MNRLAPTADTEPGPNLRNGNSGTGGNHGATPPRRRSMDTRIATSARVLFIILAVIAFCYQAATVVIPLVLALFASMMLKPPMRWLARLRVPAPLAATLVVVMAVFTIGSGVLYMGRPAVEWLNAAPENIPRLREKFIAVLRPAAQLSAAASKVGNLDPVEDTTKQVQAVEVKDNHVAHTVFTWTGGLLAGVGETIGLVFLLLAFGDGFVQKMVEALPTVPDKKRAIKIHEHVQEAISTYLFSVGLINLVFGVLVGVAFHLLGMPNALMWGGVAALVNFIPYFGPILGILAVVVAGLLGFETIGRGLSPGIAYLVLHLIEANFITPFILGRRFTLNPVIIFIALIFWAWLWGIIGALLAVPMLVALKVICEQVPAYLPLRGLISSKE